MRRLGNKILLAMVLVVFTISAAFLIYFVTYVSDLLEERVDHEGMMQLRNLARSSELGIFAEEDRFLRGPFEGVLASPDALYVVAYDLSGRLIKESSKVDVDTVLSPAILDRIVETKETFVREVTIPGYTYVRDFYAPVVVGRIDAEIDEAVLGIDEPMHEGALIGIVRMGMYGADIVAARRKVIMFGISVAIIVFLITTVVVMLFARRLTRPLVKLREGAQRVAKGDLNFQIRVSTQDEVGALANSFNLMTKELQGTTFSRDYVNNIFGSMIDTLVVIDDVGIIHLVNPALLKLLGYEERELVGKPFEAILDDPRMLSTDEWDEFLATGELRDFELNYLTKNGTRIPVNFAGAIMVDRRGAARSIVGVAHDMREINRLMDDLERRRGETEQARLEADMERRRLVSLLSSLSEGVIMFDPTGEVVMVNPYARRLMRISPDAKIDHRMLQEVEWLKIDDMMKSIMATPNKSIYREVELTFPVPQDIRIATSRVLTKDGRELGLVMILHDVTEERQMDRMRDEFVATVSHDLRTPLTTIKGFAALMLGGKAGKLSDKQCQFLTHIEESADHLHKLINDLLDLSRIRAGKLVMQVEKIDLCEVVVESIRMNAHAAENKNLHLEVNVPQEGCLADADFERMKEVLNNLIGNAIKYTPSGGIIGVALTEQKDSCLITVHDTGVGILREHQAVIFDKFRSVPHAGVETSLSTGLGLSIVKGIVEAHRGSVWVESEPGHGSTFFVTIPLSQR